MVSISGSTAHLHQDSEQTPALYHSISAISLFQSSITPFQPCITPFQPSITPFLPSSLACLRDVFGPVTLIRCVRHLWIHFRNVPLSFPGESPPPVFSCHVLPRNPLWGFHGSNLPDELNKPLVELRLHRLRVDESPCHDRLA